MCDRCSTINRPLLKDQKHNSYLAQIGVGSIVEKGHGELVASEQDGIRVILLRRETRAEVVQCRLGDHPRVS